VRIICFEDDRGRIQWGHDLCDGQAEILLGNPYTGLAPGGARAGVRRLLAPIRPPMILAIGLNYRQHAAEIGAPLPPAPMMFTKSPLSVVGPGEAIRIPACCADPPEVDYEVELAVVLGRTARDVPAARALDYVLGYTVGNDVSARRWQKRLGQFCFAKSFDTFCPLGPCLATPDEIGDPQALRLTTKLDGVLLQDSSTADMIFGVADLIAFLSQDSTLLPGTVILTGTPQGVGYTRTPPVFLRPGHTVEMEIEGIGVLRNPVAGPDGLVPEHLSGCTCGCRA
jgi:2-keto-4-pentenoate hydratase/2-oxohepta-3-ene-1,7-dioic acid hydratase in catechol pathway